MANSQKSLLTPVILSGGFGSRLWPLSRRTFPKQFWPLDYNSKLSLLQNTIKRLSPLKHIDKPIIICNEDQRFLVAEQCREIDMKVKILIEPTGKNTAPAIVLSALYALKQNNESRLIILSSDHIISNEEQFFEAINCGEKFIENDKLVTFGVIPDRAETGYGYIEVEGMIDNKNLNGKLIKNFIEKPNLKKAKEFIKKGKHLWNSGIFMFKASLIINEFKKYSSNDFEILRKAFSKSINDLDFLRIDKENFNKCTNISIDKAIMEKTDLGVVIPLDKGWCDIGSWQSLWNFSPKDIDNNCISGKVYSEKSSNNYIRSENRLVVSLGMQNTVIVETEDAVLVSNIEHTQEIKNIVNKLCLKGFNESISHNLVYRPWGSYKSMLRGERWQVKLINVKPNESLSLQMHLHRAEHWVVVQGTAKVEVEDKISYISENEGIHIPIASKHRLSNPGKITLLLIEIQVGTYTNEDDIIRFSDDYGRSQ